MRRRDEKNKDDPRNKLRLGEFHRNNIKKKNRKPSLKKKLRDAQRLMERAGMPEEIKQAKEKEAKLLKKSLKKQKEAVRFELKYKKVKFTGKSSHIQMIQLRETQDNQKIRASEQSTSRQSRRR